MNRKGPSIDYKNINEGRAHFRSRIRCFLDEIERVAFSDREAAVSYTSDVIGIPTVPECNSADVATYELCRPLIESFHLPKKSQGVRIDSIYLLMAKNSNFTRAAIVVRTLTAACRSIVFFASENRVEPDEKHNFPSYPRLPAARVRRIGRKSEISPASPSSFPRPGGKGELFSAAPHREIGEASAARRRWRRKEGRL